MSSALSLARNQWSITYTTTWQKSELVRDELALNKVAEQMGGLNAVEYLAERRIAGLVGPLTLSNTGSIPRKFPR